MLTRVSLLVDLMLLIKDVMFYVDVEFRFFFVADSNAARAELDRMTRNKSSNS